MGFTVDNAHLVNKSRIKKPFFLVLVSLFSCLHWWSEQYCRLFMINVDTPRLLVSVGAHVWYCTAIREEHDVLYKTEHFSARLVVEELIPKDQLTPRAWPDDKNT